MGISSINNTTNSYVWQNNNKTAAAKSDEKQKTTASSKTDTIVKGRTGVQNNTYDNISYRNSVTSETETADGTDKKIGTADNKKSSAVQELIDANNQRMENFRAMIEQLITKQAKSSTDAGVMVKIDFKTRDAAKAAISEGGEFSVDAVAGRIIDFAKAVSGGDKTKIDTLKNAFIDGFEAAKKAFGGTLPDISQQTYDEVMKRFDAWEKE